MPKLYPSFRHPVRLVRLGWHCTISVAREDRLRGGLDRRCMARHSLRLVRLVARLWEWSVISPVSLVRGLGLLRGLDWTYKGLVRLVALWRASRVLPKVYLI